MNINWSKWAYSALVFIVVIILLYWWIYWSVLSIIKPPAIVRLLRKIKRKYSLDKELSGLLQQSGIAQKAFPIPTDDFSEEKLNKMIEDLANKQQSKRQRKSKTYSTKENRATST